MLYTFEILQVWFFKLWRCEKACISIQT